MLYVTSLLNDVANSRAWFLRLRLQGRVWMCPHTLITISGLKSSLMIPRMVNVLLIGAALQTSTATF